MDFSIITVVNEESSGEQLEKTFSCLSAQSHKPHEVLVVKDGGVRHDADVVIQRYRESLNISAVRLDNEVGFGLALQVGLLRTTTEWVSTVACGETFLSNRFQMQSDLALRNPCDAVLGYISENDEKVAPRRRHPWDANTLYFKKKAALSVGGYDSCRDLECYQLWARMSLQGCSVYESQETFAVLKSGVSYEDVPWRMGLLHYEVRLQLRNLPSIFGSLLKWSKGVFQYGARLLSPPKRTEA